MPVALMVPSSPTEFFSEGGLTTIVGAGTGLIAGEFLGTLFTTYANVTGYTALAVKFAGQLVTSGILFFLGRRFRGMAQTFLYVAGAIAPAGIVADLFVQFTTKTAASYAAVSALSLRQVIGRMPVHVSAPQVIYSKTLQAGRVSAGQVLYSRTTSG